MEDIEQLEAAYEEQRARLARLTEDWAKSYQGLITCAYDLKQAYYEKVKSLMGGRTHGVKVDTSEIERHLKYLESLQKTIAPKDCGYVDTKFDTRGPDPLNRGY